MSRAFIIDLDIAPEGLDEYLRLSLENCRATRTTEPGCLRFEVMIDPDDRSKVTVFEAYTDDEAVEAHRQSEHFRNLRAKAAQWITVRDRRELTLLE